MNLPVLFFQLKKKNTDIFHLNCQHKEGFKNCKNLENNLINLVVNIIKWLSGLKNGNGIKSNSNKNNDLNKMKAITRK